jgi:hypothetical protein
LTICGIKKIYIGCLFYLWLTFIIKVF